MFVDDGTELPTFCMSANISKSDKGVDLLNPHRQNCSEKLKWFVCKNGKDIIVFYIGINFTWNYSLLLYLKLTTTV